MIQYPTQDQVTAVRMMEAVAQFIVLAQMAPRSVLDAVSNRLDSLKDDGPEEARFLGEMQAYLAEMKKEALR